MNRHERRAAKKTGNKFVDDYVLQLPEISAAEVMSQRGRGRVIHVVTLHDDWCPVLKEGGGMEKCNCNPQISYHNEPVRS